MAVVIKSKKLTLESLVTQLFDEHPPSSVADQMNILVASGFTLATGPTKFAIMIDTGTEVTIASEVFLKLETVTLCLKQQAGPAVAASIRLKVKNLVVKAYQYMMQTEHPMTEVTNSKLKPFYIVPALAKEEVMEAYHHAAGGGKVAAIKVFKNLTNLSLKEAKATVELWMDEEHYTDVKWIPAGDSKEAGLKKGEMLTTIGHQHTSMKTVPEFKFGSAKKKTDTYAEAAKALADYSYTETDKAMITAAQEKEIAVDFGNIESVAVSYWKSGTTVKIPVVLKNATQLHQPVRGTDPVSVYHVIAIGDDIVVAARIRKSNEIAIRAVIKAHHATKIAQRIVKGFEAAGLEKKKQGHWSLHLSPTSLLLAQRSIGSTLFAMGVQFAGISTNIEQLQGAGK